jgi:hypothetical protein
MWRVGSLRLWVWCFWFCALGLVRGSIYLAADLTARLRCVNIPRSRKRRSDARGVACPGLRRSKCSNRARANCSNAHECASIHVSVVRRGNCAESAISIDPTSISRGSHVDPTSIPSQHSKPSGFHLCGVPNACSGRTHGISKAAFDRTTSRRTRHALRSGDVQKAESGPTVSCAIVGIPIAQSTAQTAARIADQSKEMRDES